MNMKTLIILFLLSLTIIGVGYSLLSQELKLEGKTTLIKQEPEKERVRLTYQKQEWGSGPYTAQYDITLENISDETFDGWTIYIPIPEGAELSSCWNVKCSIENNKLVLTNDANNGNLSIGAKLAFGVILKTPVSNFELENPVFSPNEDIVTPPEEAGDEIKVSYVQAQKWFATDGYHIEYNITVTNKGTETIDGWSFKLKMPSTVRYASSWGCNYIEQTDGIIFSNVSYNGELAPNASTTFSCTIVSQDENFKLETVNITRTK